MPASVPQTCLSPSLAISVNGTSPDPRAHTAAVIPSSRPIQPSGSPVCSNWKHTPARLHVWPLLWSKQPSLCGLSPSVAGLAALCLSTGSGDTHAGPAHLPGPLAGRLRKAYLSPPSGWCLLSSCSNSSEASTIPLSVWLSCAGNSEAVPT